MLLMVGVGLHFSIADLMAVQRIAIPGAVGQIVIATAIGAAMAMTWGWTLGSSLVLGLSLSVASTVVMLKALEERNAVATPNGRIAIGWLVVEDLAMVLALVLLPALAPVLGGKVGDHGPAGGNLWFTLAKTLGAVAAFIGLALFFGPRVLPWILRQVARTGSRELFTLSVLAIALGIAFGSAKVFGVSFALGAFFAGMVLNESSLSHKAAANLLPLQDAFAVLFFVSVGMLFDPTILIRQPLMVAGVVALVVVGKSLVALAIVRFMKYPLSSAFTISASLAQIGEFSFILGGVGVAHGLLTTEGFNLILAGALFSISLNPLVFAGVDRLGRWARSHPALSRHFEEGCSTHFARLQADLELAREQAEKKAAEHRICTPEELVEKFPIFAGLTLAQREALSHHFHPEKASPGDRIIRKGDPPDAVYFITSGEVEVDLGERRIKLEAGQFFGEMALINNQPRSADVTALDFSEFMTLSVRDFRQFLRRYPEIREQISALAAQRSEANQQFARSASSDASSASPPAVVG
jgi:CPA2 family monovalent cation:H+ antiporter-2